MLNKFFGFGEGEKKNTQNNSSTSATDGESNQMSLTSPKKQFDEFLLMNNCLEKELAFKLSNRQDDYRCFKAYEDGGIICDDELQVSKLRSVGKEMIKLIGRKILSGAFNLTKISFPIRACHPKTALHNSVVCASTFPYFLNEAAKINNNLERFKLVIACFASSPYYLSMFMKPLNPILGETLQGSLIDGTLIYAQQISHHPPISYFLVVGPNDEYRFYGYYDFQISPGLNSLSLKNLGKRSISFKDGTVIEGTYSANHFSSTFFGTSRVEERDSCVFEDKKNGLKCEITFDKVKKRPSDYFESEIVHNGKPVCRVFGTYCGYIEFDGARYWDGRDVNSLHMQLEKKDVLPSDWAHRSDIKQLSKFYGTDNLDNAQTLKENLEQLQRRDAKLRKKFQEKEEARLKELNKSKNK